MRARVVFADSKVKEAYESLAGSKTEGRGLQKRLDNAFDAIAKDAFCSIQIPKKQIPKEYIAKYGIENIWKYNLASSWRLLYSVAGDEVIVLAIILEWLPHKEYERRFKY